MRPETVQPGKEKAERRYDQCMQVAKGQLSNGWDHVLFSGA